MTKRDPSSNLARLRADHAELVRLCGRIGTLVEGDCPPSSIDLFHVRRELRRLLIAHLEAEDDHLYPNLMASEDAQIRATATQFVDEMGGLAAAFDAYSQAWTPERTEREWFDYQRETRTILDALGKRIARENRELYPLLERRQSA